MAQVNFRTINIDALDPETSQNFDLSTLVPATVQPVSAAEVTTLIQQIRQLLRGGDAAGALRSALELVPYGADEKSKEQYTSAVIEILQSIRQAEMAPLLTTMYSEKTELLDVLMKVLYKGMGISSSGAGSATHTPSSATALNGPGFSQMAGRSFSAGAGAGGAAGSEAGGQVMSVLLSWHERVVDIAGLGAISRVMTDRRRV